MPRLQKITEATSESVWIPVGDDADATLQETTRSIAASASRELAVSSPFYNRILDAILDSVLPPNLEVEFEPANPGGTIKDAFDWFWNSGPSALKHHAKALMKTYLIDGELLLLPRVNPSDGRVTLTFVPSTSIESFTQAEGYVNISKVTVNIENESKTFDVINSSSLFTSSKNGIFYFRLFPAGYSVSRKRGSPLLIASLDHISAFTEFAYRRMSILSKLATFYWEVIIEGASQNKIDDFLNSRDSAPPDGGEIFAHNERISWKAVTPEIKTINDEIEAWLNIMAGMAGLSPEFLGRSTGRDITSESLLTSIIHLRSIQSDLFYVLSQLIGYQLSRAAAHSVPRVKPPEFRIIARTLGSRSSQRSALALRGFTNSLNEAVETGLITKEEARTIYHSLLAQLDVLPPSKTNPETEPKAKEETRNASGVHRI